VTETAPFSATVEDLRALPLPERREALESLVVREFKATLLMTDDEELPLDGSYFDLGLTSLRITDIKQRLEGLLGRGINANLLFNRPTVGQLLAHLTEDVLPEVFAPPPEPAPAGAVPAAVAGFGGGAGSSATPGAAPTSGTADGTVGGPTRWADVLDDLYRR